MKRGELSLKEGLHPKFYQSKVRCNCGNEFVTGSTKPEIRVEVCSKCHPFYTGSQKLLVEAGGRVEKFRKKYNLPNA
jgi:large subunit ribosomal protein L31